MKKKMRLVWIKNGQLQRLALAATLLRKVGESLTIKTKVVEMATILGTAVQKKQRQKQKTHS